MTLEYNTDLFKEETILRMMGHLEMLVQRALADPDQCLAELPMLTQAEQQQQLITWNDTQSHYPQDAYIHQLFEAQAGITPDAVALIGNEQQREAQQMTYRALNAQANRLAHFLRSQGVGAESRVGICLDRSFDMIISLLAVFKAGATYVPLDPNYPEERLKFMVTDSQAEVILTYQKYVDCIPSMSAKLICLDDIRDIMDHCSETNFVLNEPPSEIAYVMYTSGSTGRPKGVQGLHRGAINRFCWMWEAYPFHDDEVCCQKTTLNFVDSVWEIFGPLLKGIPLVLIPDEEVKDPSALVSTLGKHKVSRLVLVPSLLQAILDSYSALAEQLPDLQIWVTSGEALSHTLADRFQAQMPQRQLINLYGSTEVSGDCTYFEVPQTHNYANIPIGRPIANTQTYVLDRNLNPVPVGVIGDLYIGGANIAEGYFNQPSLSQARFIPNPFQDDPQARLYQMGDLARYLSDGTIEYCGRRDHQVKIRGFRVELGEVEEKLTQYPAVDQAIVVMREDQPAEKRLVAYVVLKSVPTESKQAERGDELRVFLKQHLPDYMMPSVFVILESLPLMPNGKIDRQNLPVPDQNRALDTTAIQAPRNHIERQLIEIWETLLNIKPIGINDNFFDLGGHSLMAIQLFTHINQTFESQLSVARLFQAPTVAELAELLRCGDTVQANAGLLVPIQPLGTQRSFFCIHGFGGGVTDYAGIAAGLDNEQPFYGIQRTPDRFT